ncbi:MAG: hypothetical protein P8M25_03025 [Paracoccaceae bacterium]|nr:hypothetical protein [Paracoccaceae bacterium]
MLENDQKFEFMTFSSHEIEEKLGIQDTSLALNELHNEGWELVAVDSDPEPHFTRHFFLKRPKLEKRIPITFFDVKQFQNKELKKAPGIEKAIITGMDHISKKGNEKTPDMSSGSNPKNKNNIRDFRKKNKD